MRNEDVFYVYVYFNPLKDMQPFYVGRGRGNRVLNHVKWKPGRNLHKNATIEKIRRETGGDPPFVIHQGGLSHAESCRIEMELIALYGRADLGTGPLTNLTDGGEGTINICLDARRRMSLAKAGTIAAITADGQHIRVANDDPRWLSGDLAGQTKGLPCSDATREAAIKTHRGKKQNPAVVEKRAAALRGKPKSAAHIAALSLARRGLVMVRPIGGGPSFKVPANDPRLLSGELVGVTAGRFWVHNPITKVNMVIAGDVPDGFVKGRMM